MEQENFNVKAPLLLFPVKMDRTSENVILKNDFSRDILYNTNLILANNKFNGKNEVYQIMQLMNLMKKLI